MGENSSSYIVLVREMFSKRTLFEKVRYIYLIIALYGIVIYQATLVMMDRSSGIAGAGAIIVLMVSLRFATYYSKRELPDQGITTRGLKILKLGLLGGNFIILLEYTRLLDSHNILNYFLGVILLCLIVSAFTLGMTFESFMIYDEEQLHKTSEIPLNN